MRFKILTIALLTASASVACSKFRSSSHGGGGGNNSEAVSSKTSDDFGNMKSSKPTDPAAAPPAPEAPMNVRVRNFEQFLYSMENLSGIQASDATIIRTGVTVNSIYISNKDNLPASSKATETAPVNVKAYTDVAAGFAQRLFLGTDALAIQKRTELLGSDITTAPDQFFTDAIYKLLLKKAWGGSVPESEMGPYVQVLKDMVADLKSSLPVADQNTALGSKKLCVAAWAVIAASEMVY